MQRATLAIAAFGVTAYELAYLGIPTLLLGHYEDQLDKMDRFSQWGGAVSLGWGREFDQKQLFERVTDLLANPGMRQEMSEKGKALVDPKGPLRVAEAIVAATREPASVLQD